MTILVTGGAGFIGSNFILDWFENTQEELINIDKLTYAGNLENLRTIQDNKSYVFIKGCITDQSLISKILNKYNPRLLINFAAESHVDRSIYKPSEFIQTNIIGTFNLLEESYKYWQKLECKLQRDFRFLHISTDEVYGSLSVNAQPFKENNRYEPNSPYSASKASSDHLVRAYFHTYKFPTLTTNCSNNYGPYHFPEKLIPLTIVNALNGENLPIYGDGKQIRDWLYVKDHCAALKRVIEKGVPGNVYNIGGWNEKTNISVVELICKHLDAIKPRADGKSYAKQITFIKDRPGHDLRYAIDASKIENELNWRPKETFEMGIKKTINWYLENEIWVKHIKTGNYKEWINNHYSKDYL